MVMVDTTNIEVYSSGGEVVVYCRACKTQIMRVVNINLIDMLSKLTHQCGE